MAQHGEHVVAGPRRAAVIVSGGDAVSPFTTPELACRRGLPAGNTNTAIRTRLLDAGMPVFTAPAMNGRGQVQEPPADSFGAFGDSPLVLPAHMTIVSNGDLDNAGEHLARFITFLYAEYGVVDIDWVGHSNGGLFALAASRILRETGSPVVVRSLTTLGTPWEGGVLNRAAFGEVSKDELLASEEVATLMAGFRQELETELGLAAQDTHRYLLGDDGWLAANRGVLEGVPVLLVGGSGLVAPVPDGPRPEDVPGELAESVNAAVLPDPTIWPHDGFVSESSALARSVPTGVLGPAIRRSYPLLHSIYVAEVLGRPWQDGLTWNTEVLDDVARFIGSLRV